MSSGNTAPVPNVPAGGFRYPSTARTTRRYARPESYSETRAAFKPRGWNVNPPIYHAPSSYLRRIFGPGKDEHTRTARAYLRARRRALAVLGARCARFTAAYGEGGALISGGFRAHWPDSAKDSTRAAARRVTSYSCAAETHWRAAGRLMQTFRAALGGE